MDVFNRLLPALDTFEEIADVLLSTLHALAEFLGFAVCPPPASADDGLRIALMRGNDLVLDLLGPTLQGIPVLPHLVIGKQGGAIFGEHYGALVTHESDYFAAIPVRHQVGHHHRLELTVIIKGVVD